MNKEASPFPEEVQDVEHKEAVSGIDVPDIPLEEFEVPSGDIESAIGVVNEYTGSVDFGVIGSGQCGGRLARSFYSIGYKKVLALNTAEADLNPLDIPDVQKMLIGDAQGSGKSMNKGEKATVDASQRISDKMREVFGTVGKIIICVGFGGGTGAGGLGTLISIATKYLADLGNENPALDVIVLAALPTAGELKSYAVKQNNDVIQGVIYKKADKGEVGPIFFLDNSKIEKLYRGVPMKDFWSKVNDTITMLFQMFNYLCKQESEFTSFDAEDYKTVLTTPGLAVLGVSRLKSGEGEKVQLSQALQDNFKKTLLARSVDYETAKEAACVVVVDEEFASKGSMDIVNYGFDALHNLVGDANLHRGIYSSGKVGVRAYTLITGMKSNKSSSKSVY